LVAAGLWWYSHLTEKLVYQQNTIKGRLLVDQAMYIEHLYAWGAEKSVAPLTKMLVADLRKEDYEYSFITSKSLAAAQQEEKRSGKDRDFELDVVNHFVNTALEPSRHSATAGFVDRLLPDRNEYQYYQPVYADASACVICHISRGDTALGSLPISGGALGSVPPLNQGDLMAIAKITLPFPNPDARAALARNRAWLVAIAIAVLLGVFISYFVLRYTIVWRAKRLHGPAV
jgi:hypothetical protein